MTDPSGKLDRVAEILEHAAGLSGAARVAYLREACGDDDALRAEVESLLAAQAEQGGFLAEPTCATALGLHDAPAASAPHEQAGQQIGRYKLLEQIGEGGFGTVWMAEQREPVKRRVALKVIKLGMDTKQVIARFEAERQALAMMDHPNIARVLDAGSTDAGRPYFVMEYVRGVSIVEYCDTERLDTRARLGLFVQTCRAIQHAHQKGIIHRDIKPSNVMVTLHDGVPVPKVIDFGVAKATGTELTQKTLFTQHRQMIGTPAYMSPEQAEMSGLDIDTRSDVYALGVLLYELLTGTTPFDMESLLQAGLAEMLRVIREEEPHKPSTRLSSLGDTASRTAEQRRVDLRKLNLLLRGDLDWIVMKCLEKDRTRRYETANGLAEDVRRHLTDEPVTAGPPSARYRFRKFLKRHRASVVAATIVAFALGLGAAGTIAGVLRAQTAEATARALQPQADEYRARQLRNDARDLWPPHPEMIDALSGWVDAAREFTHGLPDYRTRLEDREVEEEALLLTALVGELEQLGDDDGGLLATDAVVPGHGWSVPKRLGFAQRLASGFAEHGAYAAAWAEARREIPLALADLDADGKREEEAYPGLDLEPQMGLLPLGPDPDSGLWEFAHLMTGVPAARDENKKLVLTEETGLVLVLIPGGTFSMGFMDEPPENRPEFGKRAVTLSSPYFLSKYEMTQGQWKRLTGVNPSAYGPDAEWKEEWLASPEPSSLLHPVEQVSWSDCEDWLRRAGLSIPSEAQWERAARAGTNTTYSTGEERATLLGAANVRDQYAERELKFERYASYERFDDGSAVHWAVGEHDANGFGLHDVHGNVQEWCLDDYVPYGTSYPTRASDPVVLVTSDDNRGALSGSKLIRGGSWRVRAHESRSGDRYHFPPDVSHSGMGVRPARAITNR
jgi:formylglycine-generating enzyme required for sulfatase activity/tRNA A-37 threonylcarbamoyl transferase component Bud32